MNQTIVLTGGGSGGHITPLLAVADELKRTHPNIRIVYIGSTGDGLADIPQQHPAIDTVYSVRAGKFRRYHGEGWKQILDVKTFAKNVRDAVYVVIGFWQARKLLKQIQPSVIFIKGGFVGVPVGLAAVTRKIPFITHDSDAIPGLANRIIARWADIHAVALPESLYSYPQDKTVSTGIPLRSEFVPVTAELKQTYRKSLDLPIAAPVLLVIGGGLGSQRINGAVGQALPYVLQEYPDLYLLHAVGRGNEPYMSQLYAGALTESQLKRVQVLEFVTDVYRYSGSADIIVTRAGATNLAEFALQGKACVVVPSPFLTGGHQLKNANALAERNAAIVLDETSLLEDPNRLAKLLSEMLKNKQQIRDLGTSLHELAKPHATRDIAQLLLKYTQLPK